MKENKPENPLEEKAQDEVEQAEISPRKESDLPVFEEKQAEKEDEAEKSEEKSNDESDENKPHGEVDSSFNCSDCKGDGIKDGVICVTCHGTGKV